MPPRNKRKRPGKAEPSDSDREYEPTSDEPAQPKRVKTEVKEEAKVEELSDGDFAIVLSDLELSDSSSPQTGRPVRRSAGGRPPRRGVDVSALYEEAGAGHLARSLGQVVKEERVVAATASDDVRVEDGSGSPLRVSDYVRRAAAVRAAQLLRNDEAGTGRTMAGGGHSDGGIAKRHNARKRVKFTEEQRAVLRAQFDTDPYPDTATKEGLSQQLGVHYKSIQHWFQWERARQGTTMSDYDSARKKCVFGPAVYDELVAQFKRSPRPDLATRKALAAKSGGSVQQIYHWFQKRRQQQIDSPRKVEITPTLRAELEAVFKANPYPERETRMMLAEKIGCSMKQISNWFYHRRRKAGIMGSDEGLARRSCQFGPEGYDRLVAQFEADPYPDVETRVALAAELGGTVVQVSDWFQNRRSSDGINEGNSARYQCSLGPVAYDELVAAFEADPFPDGKTRAALATKTGGTLKQISSWFCGRRQKEGIKSRSDTYARSVCKFGAHVYDELVAQFEADPFPDSVTVKTLAQKGGGTPQQIRGWFFHRRKRLGMQRNNEEGARLTCKFGPEVYDHLVAQYEVSPHPRSDVIEELAERAEATAKQIRNWFWYRRKKQRRQKQK